MTLAQIKTALKKTNYPVAYTSFDTPQNPPYIVYSFESSNNILADNSNYVNIGLVKIDLYASKKDIVAENALENILKADEVFDGYEKTGSYLENENLFITTYESEVIIDV